jgi:deoxyribonuclease V
VCHADPPGPAGAAIIEPVPAVGGWPTTVDELIATQEALAEASPPAPWSPPAQAGVAGCFVCFRRDHTGPGETGEPGWGGAALYRGKRRIAHATSIGRAGAPYMPGLLALRLGALLHDVTRLLPIRPDVLVVDATGYDHPRRFGLARHLGAVLQLPTVGVTHRPMLASGGWPADHRGAMSPLRLEGVVVGFWVRTRERRRPLAVHAGWRTDPEVAAQVVLAASRHRTPTPLREARRLARTARASALR